MPVPCSWFTIEESDQVTSSPKERLMYSSLSHPSSSKLVSALMHDRQADAANHRLAVVARSAESYTPRHLRRFGAGVGGRRLASALQGR